MYAVIKTGGKQYRVQEGISCALKSWKVSLAMM